MKAAFELKSSHVCEKCSKEKFFIICRPGLSSHDFYFFILGLGSGFREKKFLVPTFVLKTSFFINVS